MTTSSLLIKRSIKSAASMFPFGVGFPRVTPGSINIFAYHRIVKDIDLAERNSIYGIVISAATFRKHCEMLKQAFDVVSLETARHFLERRRLVARPLAVLTFDDGYLDLYDEAFPILNELALPATIFLPSAYIGTGKVLGHDRLFWLLKKAGKDPAMIAGTIASAGVEGFSEKLVRSLSLLDLTDKMVFLPDEKREAIISALESAPRFDPANYPEEYQLLDWDRVREMGRKGVSFGSHTLNHVVLPLESHEKAQTEIAKSKAEIEDKLGKRITSLAYPNGAYTSEVSQMVNKAGYSVAVTTETRSNQSSADPLTLGRVSLCEESTRGYRGEYSPAVASLRLGVGSGR